MLRTSLLIAALALASGWFTSLEAAVFAACPDTFYVGSIGGLPGAQSCGKIVTIGADSVNINVVPESAYATDLALESWLSLAPGGLDQAGIFADGGAALLFPSFTANAGDTLHFDWSSVFEPEATGYQFYALDGVVTVLNSQIGLANSTIGGGGIGTLPQPISQPLTAGNHSLAFGVIVGSAFGNVTIIGNQTIAECVGCVVSVFDPILDVTNLRIESAVPEPSSIALFGLGLVALATWRRKRA